MVVVPQPFQKDKFYKDYLSNELFSVCIIVGLDGKVIAYNKSPHVGEPELLVKGFKTNKTVQKLDSISINGEKYNINFKENFKVIGQNEKKSAIIIKTKKAFIIGVFPKRLEISPRISFLDTFCKQYEDQVEILVDEREKYVL
ncbi:hypothetical protein DLAC_04274 [Tieghemostelium lacteum]|uniref:Profilin n=1 Tax=Tieghemostelium lacteum TaxID=361077 RepID=A0A151ZSN0_TIELA|nr:hypothetical protein DLAC_04274 [Tieghemostelium lacteum]|eukprot:KYQ96952.1 hypothetical protein DLAC_04274 [Tieghemostelium lacteum]